MMNTHTFSHLQGKEMPEPSTTTVAAVAGAKAAGAVASSTTAAFVGGAIGAAVIMCLRLPKSRIEMFLQVVCAFGFSIPLAPFAMNWIGISRVDYTTFEHDLLTGLCSAILASVSWGVVSIIINFRDRAVRAPQDTSADFLKALRELKGSGSLAEGREDKNAG